MSSTSTFARKKSRCKNSYSVILVKVIHDFMSFIFRTIKNKALYHFSRFVPQLDLPLAIKRAKMYPMNTLYVHVLKKMSLSIRKSTYHQLYFCPIQYE